MDKEVKALLEETEIAGLPKYILPRKETIYPSGVSLSIAPEWEEELKHIRQLGKSIETQVGIRCTGIDDSVQDSNHSTAVFFGEVGARFSRYGKLFTAYNLGDEKSDSLSAKIVPIIEAGGYRYVAVEDLYTPYSGNEKRYIGTTWWDRFFDYM